MTDQIASRSCEDMISRKVAILAATTIAMAMLFTATAAAGPAVLVINTPENPVPVNLVGGLVLEVNNTAPLDVAVQGSVAIDDTDPVDVELVGAIEVDDSEPIAIQGSVNVNDTDPVDVEVIGTLDLTGWLHTTNEVRMTAYYGGGYGDIIEIETRGYRQVTIVMAADIASVVAAEWVLGSSPTEMFVFEEWIDLTGGPFFGGSRTYEVKGPVLMLTFGSDIYEEEGEARVRAYMTT
jgi:hypothetical protein